MPVNKKKLQVAKQLLCSSFLFKDPYSDSNRLIKMQTFDLIIKMFKNALKCMP